ncbi:Peptidyl-tRNA hydrolase [Anatilimnocola aggregata]|uniref:Peptidyl-tRNA hydrolase n=1 Tax=Anatilimnocola aggregata TaxID=2528021 RepID=A0A517YI59_9BACT|nr:aminoacyl-tRNA hydrolase [Anatilimnocola aggregata]QDU29906.1 Peptidyl-tRNA hydrolase [Anatilimnocola aggregata]
MKLIVGLGNPGKQYTGTRHNVGFATLAKLIATRSSGPAKAKFQGELYEATIAGQRSLLLLPLTYMNGSGASVLAARDFYKIEHPDILVICDDFALPLGKLRFRGKGSSGGQKGLDDVIRRLGSDEIPRLRIGIGAPAPGRDVPGYVLGRFAPDEQSAADESIVRAAESAEAWVEKGLSYCMNQYNAA